jgi:hypothetical protein
VAGAGGSTVRSSLSIAVRLGLPLHALTEAAGGALLGRMEELDLVLRKA